MHASHHDPARMSHGLAFRFVRASVQPPLGDTDSQYQGTKQTRSREICRNLCGILSSCSNITFALNCFSPPVQNIPVQMKIFLVDLCRLGINRRVMRSCTTMCRIHHCWLHALLLPFFLSPDSAPGVLSFGLAAAAAPAVLVRAPLVRSGDTDVRVGDCEEPGVVCPGV